MKLGSVLCGLTLGFAVSVSVAQANCIDTRTGGPVSNSEHREIWPLMEVMLESAVYLGWASNSSYISECLVGERAGIVLNNGDRVLFDGRMAKYVFITRAAWDGSWPPSATCYNISTQQFYSSDVSCGDY